MEVLQILGSWDQETELWLTNHERLIPALIPLEKVSKP